MWEPLYSEEFYWGAIGFKKGAFCAKNVSQGGKFRAKYKKPQERKIPWAKKSFGENGGEFFFPPPQRKVV